MSASFSGVYRVVRDMGVSAEFYRRLGVEMPADAADQMHVAVEVAPGFQLSLGDLRMTKGYDPAWNEQRDRGTLEFGVPTREAVDALYAELTAAGHEGHQAPFDAFWGARYAVVADPDGNLVGIGSPMDESKAGPPPGV